MVTPNRFATLPYSQVWDDPEVPDRPFMLRWHLTGAYGVFVTPSPSTFPGPDRVVIPHDISDRQRELGCHVFVARPDGAWFLGIAWRTDACVLTFVEPLPDDVWRSLLE